MANEIKWSQFCFWVDEDGIQHGGLHPSLSKMYSDPSGEIAALESRLAAAEADAARWKAVKELVGHWHDGSNEEVVIFIDEATKTAFIKAGRRTFFEDGCGLDTAIDKARGGE